MADAFHGSDVIGASVSHQYGHSCGRHLPGAGDVADALSVAESRVHIAADSANSEVVQGVPRFCSDEL